MAEEQRKSAKLDRAALERYISLEQQIHEEESKNKLKELSLKKEQLTELEATVKAKSAAWEQACKQTEKEKGDVDRMDSTRDMFSDKSAFDKQMSTEQQEYLDALNNQEILKKELDGIKNQQTAIEKEVASLTKEAEVINKLYKEQDELLASIFNGSYGSDEEYKLETELDVLLDRKQRIQVAHFKWTNAKVLLNTGVKQLIVGVEKWGEVSKTAADNKQKKYTLATECRNNFIAAAQNINQCQKYLSNIQFPYVKPQEVVTLNKAITHIYTDMQSADRTSHAMQCYSITQKRASALLQWFNNVIATTIAKDLKTSTDEANKVEMALRQERLRLIKAKISDADSGANVSAVKGENELGKEAQQKTDVAVLSAGMENMSVQEDRTAAGTPLPLSELAAVPTGDELFGNIDNIKKEHEQQQQEFDKQQAINKARMEQGLAEKLKARRSRQTRQS